MNTESFRIEKDSMGEIKVPSDKLWGAQTQRSLENFKIGSNVMPKEQIEALITVKKACAMANRKLLPHKMTASMLDAILYATDKLALGEYDDQFPLSVWQTGSGTQTNMNVNEVISHLANIYLGENRIHPNDHVNMSQSSNDIFPSAMSIAAYKLTAERLIPACDRLIAEFKRIEEKYPTQKKVGRTHLQDATPIKFSEEVYGWRGLVESAREHLLSSIPYLLRLAVGGTAVGTGINAPDGFDVEVCSILSKDLGYEFIPDTNKFHALSSKDAFVFVHGAIKSLACNLFKIANDVRLLASGPRCGIGEIIIPANEPGSSIMPGKVNPTQCEALTMVCAQVMGNDATVGICASQGHFELNVFMPVIIHNFVLSANLLSDAINSFTENCVVGIIPDTQKMRENLERSLMNVTYLNTHIGYEKAATVAKLAHQKNISVKEALLELGFMDKDKADGIFYSIFNS